MCPCIIYHPNTLAITLSSSFLKNVFQLLVSISTTKTVASNDALATAHAAAWEALSAAKHWRCSWAQVSVENIPDATKGAWVDRLSGGRHGYTAVAFRLQLLREILERSLAAGGEADTESKTTYPLREPSFDWLHAFLTQGGAAGIIAAAQDLFRCCQQSSRTGAVADIASCYHGLDAALSSLLILCSFLQLPKAPETAPEAETREDDSEGNGDDTEDDDSKDDHEGKDSDDCMEPIVLCGHVGPYAKYQGVFDFLKNDKKGLPVFKRRIVVDKDEAAIFMYRCVDDVECEWWMVGDEEQMKGNEGHLASVENHQEHPVRTHSQRAVESAHFLSSAILNCCVLVSILLIVFARRLDSDGNGSSLVRAIRKRSRLFGLGQGDV